MSKITALLVVALYFALCLATEPVSALPHVITLVDGRIRDQFRNSGYHKKALINKLLVDGRLPEIKFPYRSPVPNNAFLYPLWKPGITITAQDLIEYHLSRAPTLARILENAKGTDDFSYYLVIIQELEHEFEDIDFLLKAFDELFDDTDNPHLVMEFLNWLLYFMEPVVRKLCEDSGRAAVNPLLKGLWKLFQDAADPRNFLANILKSTLTNRDHVKLFAGYLVSHPELLNWLQELLQRLNLENRPKETFGLSKGLAGLLAGFLENHAPAIELNSMTFLLGMLGQWIQSPELAILLIPKEAVRAGQYPNVDQAIRTYFTELYPPLIPLLGNPGSGVADLLVNALIHPQVMELVNSAIFNDPLAAPVDAVDNHQAQHFWQALNSLQDTDLQPLIGLLFNNPLLLLKAVSCLKHLGQENIGNLVEWAKDGPDAFLDHMPSALIHQQLLNLSDSEEESTDEGIPSPQSFHSADFQTNVINISESEDLLSESEDLLTVVLNQHPELISLFTEEALWGFFQALFQHIQGLSPEQATQLLQQAQTITRQGIGGSLPELLIHLVHFITAEMHELLPGDAVMVPALSLLQWHHCPLPGEGCLELPEQTVAIPLLLTHFQPLLFLAHNQHLPGSQVNVTMLLAAMETLDAVTPSFVLTLFNNPALISAIDHVLAGLTLDQAGAALSFIAELPLPDHLELWEAAFIELAVGQHFAEPQQVAADPDDPYYPLINNIVKKLLGRLFPDVEFQNIEGLSWSILTQLEAQSDLNNETVIREEEMLEKIRVMLAAKFGPARTAGKAMN